MRVVKFYAIYPASSASASAGPPLQAQDQSVSRPDLHRKLRIRVFPTGPPPQAQDQSVPLPPPQAQDQSVPRRISTASSGSERSPPDLRQSVPRRISTASSGSECRTCTASSGSERFPLDLHRKLRIREFPRRTSTASSGSERFPAGPPPQAQDQSVPAGLQPRDPDQSVPRRTSTASSGSERSPPDLNHKESPKIYQLEECPKRMSENM